MKKYLIELVIAAIIIVGITSLVEGNNKHNSSKATPVSQMKPKTVTSEELVKAYQENGVNADDKYKDKPLEFQGKVKTVTQSTVFGFDVVVEAGAFVEGNEFETTNAIVNVDKDTAKKIQSGQTYTFTAKGDGATVLDGGWVSILSFKDGHVK